MRSLPTTKYSGYTVILSAPSRFDIKAGRLISGVAADWFEESVLPAGYSLHNIEVRDISCRDPFLPDTRFISLHGRQAAEAYNFPIERHGYPFMVNRCPALVAFDPQDCNDHRNMRDDEDDDEDSVSDREVKDKAPTRRKNWRFWTQWHVKKLLTLKHEALPKLIPILRPRLDDAIQVLNQVQPGDDIYLDIETSRIHGCLTCIGFSTTRSFPRVYVVPVYTYDGALAYGQFHRFHRALSLAMARGKTVAHNGAGFDFLVLRSFYKFPFPADPYDTMLANHRCFPEIEKSLAHLIAQWTWLPYHKDENREPRCHDDDTIQWNYNAKDVYALKPIKDAQTRYAAGDPGLRASIAQANDSIVPYLETTRTGLRLDMLKLANTANKLELKKSVYQRIASILAAKPFNPGSADQCRKFFFDTLHYPPVARTDTGKPAIGSKQLYQLQLKHNNPLIPIILKYREAAKDLSNLESEPFEEP
jgi:hypothetical protein